MKEFRDILNDEPKTKDKSRALALCQDPDIDFSFRNLSECFNPFWKSLKGIQSYQLFRCSTLFPGAILVKEDARKTSWHRIDIAVPGAPSRLPNHEKAHIKPRPPLNPQKQNDLFKKIGDIVPPQNHSDCCPPPPAEVARSVKEARKQAAMAKKAAQAAQEPSASTAPTEAPKKPYTMRTKQATTKTSRKRKTRNKEAFEEEQVKPRVSKRKKKEVSYRESDSGESDAMDCYEDNDADENKENEIIH